MKGKKNDFSISFFNEDERVLFLAYVHNTQKAVDWVNKKRIEWTHGNIYDRRSREFLLQIKSEAIN
jgi:hypothetical protein